MVHPVAMTIRRKVVTVGHLALLSILWLLTPATSAPAAVFFDSDFEVPFICGSAGGPGPPNAEGWVLQDNTFGCNVIQTQKAVVFSGSNAMSMTFVGDAPGGAGPQLYRTPGFSTTHFFGRMMFRVSPGYQTSSNLYSKIVRMNSTNLSRPTFWLYLQGANQYVFASECAYDKPNTPELILFSNTFASSTAWQLVEWEILYNTPGVSNGLLRLWVDNVLVIEDLNRQFIGPTPTSIATNCNEPVPSTVAVTNVQFFRQSGIGTMYIDRMAVGDTRIGSPSLGNTSPPASPTGLTVK